MITEDNVDDYIRDQKKLGKKVLYWNKKDWKIFRSFGEAVTSCGGADSLEGMKMTTYCIKNHHHFPKRIPKSGFVFMGIKHFNDRKI